MKVSIFDNHLSCAHAMWRKLVRPGDFVIDATAGKGRDSLILGKLALTENSGQLWVCDVQHAALVQTRQRLKEELTPAQQRRIRYIEGCHTTLMPEQIVQLVIYNLGYLPGGDKRLTTQSVTTVASVETLLPSLAPGGAICLTLYPGHEEGEREAEALLKLATKLSALEWNCSHLRWIQRHRAPSILLIRRSASKGRAQNEVKRIETGINGGL